MKTLIKSIRLFFATLRYSFGARKLPSRFVHKNVPYFSQWESRNLVDALLKGEIQAEDDPKWRASGAVTQSEYASWSWSGCGMACFKMILAHRKNISIPLVTLGKRCARYGGYDSPLESSKGLKYRPFVTFAKDEFAITAKAVTALSVAQIISELSSGGYVIASVHASIRDVTSQPKVKGGHLVLILGYDRGGQQLYFHNPSGNTAKTQEYAVLTFNDFEKFFNHQGIVIS